MIISALLSLFFIPALVLFYFCFLMSIMMLFNGGVTEGALSEVFLKNRRRELIKVYLKFLSGGIICIAIPLFWFIWN